MTTDARWEGGLWTTLDTLTGVGRQMAFWEARKVPPARPGARCQVSSGTTSTGVFQKVPLPASGLVLEWQRDSRGASAARLSHGGGVCTVASIGKENVEAQTH